MSDTIVLHALQPIIFNYARVNKISPRVAYPALAKELQCHQTELKSAGRGINRFSSDQIDKLCNRLQVDLLELQGLPVTYLINLAIQNPAVSNGFADLVVNGNYCNN